LVFHAFLDENPNYRSLKYGYSAANAEPEKEDVEVAAVDSDGEVAVTSGPATASDWGLQFPDLTESDMMNDLVIRERLAKLLDHPSLSNHLLRAKNLLPLLVSVSASPCRRVLTLRAGKPKLHFDIGEPHPGSYALWSKQARLNTSTSEREL
jgi:hypothetical protein